MKTISIALQKGGTGKTVLGVSLAAALARRYPGRVLLIDCDPQGNSTEWTYTETLNAELASVLLGKCHLEQAVIQSDFPGLFLLPTAGLDGELKVWDEGAGSRKPFAMREVIKGAAAMGFKYCILDLSPGFGAIERAALVASDEVITPIMPDPFGISGLEIFIKNLMGLRKDLETGKPEYRRIVINAVDNRIKQHGEIVDKMRKGAGDFHQYVFPVDQVFRRAETEHKSVYDMGTAKKETIDELDRLASEAEEG
ncbi:MAG: ParA family protein [Treponema sp.]|jgi:chromosome partitioning protein|nr:ParA family protein [Treponema sp.]